MRGGAGGGESRSSTTGFAYSGESDPVSDIYITPGLGARQVWAVERAQTQEAHGQILQDPDLLRLRSTLTALYGVVSERTSFNSETLTFAVY